MGQKPISNPKSEISDRTVVRSGFVKYLTTLCEEGNSSPLGHRYFAAGFCDGFFDTILDIQLRLVHHR